MGELHAWTLHDFLARLGNDGVEQSLRELAERWVEVERHGETDGMTSDQAAHYMAGLGEAMLIMISHVPGVRSPMVVRTAMIKEAETAEMLRDA